MLSWALPSKVIFDGVGVMAVSSPQLPNKIIFLTRQIAITLCKMTDPVRYPHQTYRAYFDSCTALKYSHMVTLPFEPKAFNSIFKCLDSEIGHEWEQALYHQYSKNDAVRLANQPTPIENVPEDKKVLRTVISTKVKKKRLSLYQLVAHMCADGS